MDFLINFFSHPIVKLYTWKNNIDYYNFDNDFEKLGRSFIENFKQKIKTKKDSLPLINKKVLEINSAKINSETKYQEIYNIEYEKSNYVFINALIIDKLLELIVGTNTKKIRSLKIIDIGTGSGELEEFLINIGCPKSSIVCIDTSSASIKRIKEIGLRGFIGTLSEAKIQDNSFDLVFLSYFIEYDTTQSDTFYDAVRITNPGGKVIFEALLPATIKFPKNNKTVTRGYFLLDDISRIKKNFSLHAKKLNRDCKLEKISIGHRWVYSHYGLCRLPSIFLIFKISDKV